MATIKANGGAASVWERTGHHSDGTRYTLRVVLCRNGKVLTGTGPRRLSPRASAQARRLKIDRKIIARRPGSRRPGHTLVRLPHRARSSFRCGRPTARSSRHLEFRCISAARPKNFRCSAE